MVSLGKHKYEPYYQCDRLLRKKAIALSMSVSNAIAPNLLKLNTQVN
ncbi:MAG: hypothetical protein ACKO2V_03815 [Snowella sp.]